MTNLKEHLKKADLRPRYNACTVCGTIFPTFNDRRQCGWHLPGKEQSK